MLLEGAKTRLRRRRSIRFKVQYQKARELDSIMQGGMRRATIGTASKKKELASKVAKKLLAAFRR